MSEIQQPDTDTQVLEFILGEERYCLTIDAVNEIVKATEVTPMPDTPPAVVGMMDLRGNTTAIVNPKRVFETAEETPGEQVIIFDDDSDQQFGWLVDRVLKVETLQNPETEPVEDNQFVSGVVSRDGEFTLWVDPDCVHEQFSMATE
ncbi:chemotaxis protein CheW [Salinibaculum salinum]|uniref:chemotaxis protein CheW n=1 Tax=Salinibaculum salinum TaxID=3131996 RepID=UPI0030EE8BFA